MSGYRRQCTDLNLEDKKKTQIYVENVLKLIRLIIKYNSPSP